jgi:hypothetical protein
VARITAFLNALGANRSAQPGVLQQTASRFARSRLGRTLKFESLEDRRMLATFTVTSLSDATVTGPGSAPGTLRQAIYDANIAGDADIIDFAAGVSGDLRLSIADDSAIGLSALLITSPITIQGNAAGITIKRDITAPNMRFFRVAPGGGLTVDSINITGGITVGPNGAPSQDGGAGFGGAIYNQGSLEIIASTIYNNAAIGGNAGAGASSGAGQGGAIFNDGGSVAIRNSTLSGNSVSNGSGTVVARSFGGSVYSKNGTLNVYNSTLTNGSAVSGRDLYIIGIGAGQTATAQIFSSIIAHADVPLLGYDFTAAYDLDGQLNITGANNIIRWQNDFQSIAVSSDDPLLGTLANNGGPTLTHALQTGSPAIGHGSNLLNLNNDQRGVTFARTVGGATDIGAFELQTLATPILPGDYNASQIVDAADYVVWRKTIGTSVTQYTGADGTGDGQIDGADYEIWRGHFGTAASAAGATVPTAVKLIAAESLIAAPMSQPTDTYVLSGIDLRSNDRPRTQRNTSPVSQQARDEALLIITEQRFRLEDSELARASLHNDVESDSAKDEVDRDFLLAAYPLSQALPQIGPLAAASIGTT